MAFRECCIISGDSGTHVFPDANFTVQIIGTDGLNTVASGSTLIISSSQINSIKPDSGTLVNSIGNLINISGGTQIQTVGSGNTLTINCTAPVMMELVTFTPTISGSTSVGAGTYSLQSGWYTRINNLLYVIGSLTWSAHTGTGNMLISALPFTVRNQTNYDPEFIVRIQNIPWPAGNGYIFGEFETNTTTGSLMQGRTNQSEVPVQMNSSGTVHFTGWYLT